MMTRARKWLVAGVLVVLGSLTCGLKSTATFHVNYATGQKSAPLATLTIDQQPGIILSNDPFRYRNYALDIRAGGQANAALRAS